MNDQLRLWLASACGVAPEQVTDEHLREWAELRAKICAYPSTEESGRGVRAAGRRAGVHMGAR